MCYIKRQLPASLNTHTHIDRKQVITPERRRFGNKDDEQCKELTGPTSTSSGQDTSPWPVSQSLLWVRAQWHLKVGPQAWGHSRVGSHGPTEARGLLGCWGQTLRPHLLPGPVDRGPACEPLLRAPGPCRLPASCTHCLHLLLKHTTSDTPWLPKRV